MIFTYDEEFQFYYYFVLVFSSSQIEGDIFYHFRISKQKNFLEDRFQNKKITINFK